MNDFTTDEIYQSEKESEKSSNLPVLVAEDIIKIYRTGKIETQALRGVSFTIYEREKLFLIGPSGSGKTTLVNIVAGNIKPTSGKVFWKDLLKDITRSSYEEIIKARRSFAALISQDTRLVSHLTVKENVELVGYYANLPSSVIKQRSEFLLKFLGIWEKRNKKEDTLSGGEKKRADIAATLVTNPKVIIADEPTGDLDIITANSILDLFDKINKELHIAMLLCTHSQNVTTRADRVLEIQDGIIIGQHESNLHLRKLEQSRQLEVDRQGRIKIPAAIIDKLDNPKHFEIQIMDGKIVLSPIYKSKHFENKIKKVITCSICGKLEKDNSDFCKYCGGTIS